MVFSFFYTPKRFHYFSHLFRSSLFIIIIIMGVLFFFVVVVDFYLWSLKSISFCVPFSS